MRMATTLELGMGGRKVKEMKGYGTRGIRGQGAALFAEVRFCLWAPGACFIA